jgi:hypothetical protein
MEFEEFFIKKRLNYNVDVHYCAQTLKNSWFLLAFCLYMYYFVNI